MFFKAKGKKWTKQDDSAVIIQKSIRRYLAKKELLKRKKDKQEYDELMDKIQKEVRREMLEVTSLIAALVRDSYITYVNSIVWNVWAQFSDVILRSEGIKCVA